MFRALTTKLFRMRDSNVETASASFRRGAPFPHARSKRGNEPMCHKHGGTGGICVTPRSLLLERIPYLGRDRTGLGARLHVTPLGQKHKSTAQESHASPTFSRNLLYTRSVFWRVFHWWKGDREPSRMRMQRIIRRGTPPSYHATRHLTL